MQQELNDEQQPPAAKMEHCPDAWLPSELARFDPGRLFPLGLSCRTNRLTLLFPSCSWVANCPGAYYRKPRQQEMEKLQPARCIPSTGRIALWPSIEVAFQVPSPVP